jgi:pathogenesis-related protein 1
LRLLLALLIGAVSTGAQAQGQMRAQSMLDAHNAVRARVGVPPLVWSTQLADVARDWANHLIATGGFAHRPDNRYGENLYSIAGGTASPAQVVGYWADEARGYDIGSNTCRGVCGHYTQIVWAKTRAVGCAVATDPRREVWVCNYDPPGNVIGYRPY